MLKFFHQKKNVFLYYWTNKQNRKEIKRNKKKIYRQQTDNGERGKYMKTNHISIAPKCLIRGLSINELAMTKLLHEVAFPPAT